MSSKKDKRLDLRIDAPTLKMLDELAASSGEDRSSVLRNLIRDAKKREEHGATPSDLEVFINKLSSLAKEEADTPSPTQSRNSRRRRA